ncbi:MAG: hypothetical protein R3313_03450, partial [Candidatus Saccharimonadales bacterium]|nr:hypothetical protein [Candidatus Saccharimonadales bacterium]
MKSRRLTSDVTVVAMSFGFIVLTRMLQKYPESRAYTKDIISVMGFGRWTDFTLSNRTRKTYIYISKLFRTKLGSWLVKTFVFNRVVLKLMFWIFSKFNPKYQQSLGEERKAGRAMEERLWRSNDARTKFYTWVSVLTVDLTITDIKIPLKVYNMYSKTDQYFDSQRVKQSLKKLYQDYVPSVANSTLHAPSILGDRDEIDRMYSDDIKQLLSKS